MRKLIVIALAALIASGWVVRPRPGEAGVLRYTAASPILTMDPHATADYVTGMVVGQVYEGLIGVDADMALRPALATRWEAVSNTVWRFHLRPGVRFHLSLIHI